MYRNTRRLIFLLFAGSLTACSGRTTTTIPATPARVAAAEQVIVVGAASEQKATIPGQYSAVIASSDNSAEREYSFNPDVHVYRHAARGGDTYIEFHGKADATFFRAEHVKRLTMLSVGGVKRPIELSSLPAQRRTQDCHIIMGAKRAVQNYTDCGGGGDPGPCVDCSGPMAPGGWLSCAITGACGGDPEFGTGFGVGIFRSVDPDLSCEYNFADGTYFCDFDVANTSSTAPEDLSNGYGYNEAMGAQLLHCKGPSQKSEAFVTGKNPDSRTGINLGFRLIRQGQAVAHAMVTKWTVDTAMNAQYFGVGFLNLPFRYDGWCAGVN